MRQEEGKECCIQILLNIDNGRGFFAVLFDLAFIL